jgi:putative transcriptional regulator
MVTNAFEQLVASVREGAAILRGQRRPARRFVVGGAGIRSLQERTQLSQSEFALLMGVSVKTLQNWEQERRRPTDPAAALFRLIAAEPVFAMTALRDSRN